MKDNELEKVKGKYIEGTRIKLLKDMADENIPAGTMGTVTHVDDIGTIHVNWDNHSSLGLIFGKDEFEIMQSKENIRVILVEVGKDACITEIPNTLKSEQKIVGGRIQTLPTYFSTTESYNFIMNEEWRNNNLPLNCHIFDYQDMIGGDVLIVKADESSGEFISMEEDEATQVLKQFNENCPRCYEVGNKDNILEKEEEMEH